MFAFLFQVLNYIAGKKDSLSAVLFREGISFLWGIAKNYIMYWGVTNSIIAYHPIVYKT